MRVLSLFDGMSCGQIALKELGIIPEVYFASEIEKSAIEQTNLNFPDTVQLGSVCDVDADKLGRIDLVLAGSPCTNLSIAGRKNGMNVLSTNEQVCDIERYLQLKKDGFQFDGQSYLFWEFVRILKQIQRKNPDVKFLLENVSTMGKKWDGVISRALETNGLRINSSLVSAQTRSRIYWTNINARKDFSGFWFSDIPIPKDRGIMLKDVLQKSVEKKYFMKFNEVQKYFDISQGGNLFVRKTIKNNPYKLLYNSEKLLLVQEGTKKGFVEIHDGECFDFEYPNSQTRRGRKMANKSNAILASAPSYYLFKDSKIRRFTPTECARLQTIPEWYRWNCSERKQYKMIGNGWTVETIKYILSFL